MASAVARAESKALRSVPSIFLISKSGPKAETVAGESSSAMRTIGLGKVKILGKLGEEKSCHNEAIYLSLVKDPLLTPEQSSGVRLIKG
jgi:hypothetical protein